MYGCRSRVLNRIEIPRRTLAIERPRDLRKFGRRPVFKAAVIELHDGQRLSGTVLDLSEGGARIKLPEPERLNGEFYLEIPGDDLIVKCRLIRIDDAIAGLSYVRPPRRLSWVRK
ncbi:PilZ domain-containing protein [Hyphomicrobium facile]|uniref:PilZ domain-containing protein n=1 Tax=Hyphomicrobium facile TaxID=51670 RepID=UPI001FCE16DA|nr:PilZ domain-containing protein [Hyphomicrobium facile]